MKKWLSRDGREITVRSVWETFRLNPDPHTTYTILTSHLKMKGTWVWMSKTFCLFKIFQWISISNLFPHLSLRSTYKGMKEVLMKVTRKAQISNGTELTLNIKISPKFLRYTLQTLLSLMNMVDISEVEVERSKGIPNLSAKAMHQAQAVYPQWLRKGTLYLSAHLPMQTYLHRLMWVGLFKILEASMEAISLQELVKVALSFATSPQ